MSLRYKYKQDKGVSQADLTPQELINDHKKVVESNADYYSEWAIEKCTIEKPKSRKSGKYPQSTSDSAYQTNNYDQYF
jgi:hypothetical protein